MNEGGLKKIEKKYGLPSLQGIVDMMSGEKASVIKDILTRIEKLSKQQQMLKDASELIKLIMQLDSNGTLTRMTETLERIEPLIRDKTIITKLLDRFDKIEQLIRELTKVD